MNISSDSKRSCLKIVYLPEDVTEVMQEYKIWYRENNEYKDDYFVFGAFYKSEKKIRFREQLKNTNKLKKIKIHEFRHSHASDYINRLRMDIDTLESRLGTIR